MGKESKKHKKSSGSLRNVGSRNLIIKLLPQLSESIPFTFYAGNLNTNQSLFSDFPINTDDHPLIEFLAPKALGTRATGKDDWVTGLSLEQFFDELENKTPPEEDPYLKELNNQQLEYVRAGLSYYRSILYEFNGLQDKQKEWFDDYLNKMNFQP